ncbi:MAG: SAM-dependent methyltransferase [Desulfobacterales bacterium]
MAQKAAGTGPGPTLMVALEQHLPENVRIVKDDLAHRILPFGSRVILWIKLRLMSVENMVTWTEKKMPGMWSGFMCRKRYIDDKVNEAVISRVEAVVNLGAGFDTRVYRLAALSGVPVWEVDQPGNIEAKRKRLRHILKKIPPNVTLVPIDFDQEALNDLLTSNGYLPDVTTFFIWEAVTQYLPETSIRATFKFLETAPSGSRLIFTYIRKDFIEGTVLYGHTYLFENMVKKNIWRFGFDPDEIVHFLSGYGWRVLEHLGYDELAERYVKPTGRNLQSTPIERIVYASRM